MNKNDSRIMLVLLSLISIVVLYGMVLLFYPFRTLVVNESTAKTQTIKAGDVFVYTIDYCKYTEKPAIVSRTFHKTDESVSVPFPFVNTISVEGCNITDVPLQTFPTITPGTYYLLVDVEFKINVLRNVHVIFQTNEFEIK